MLMCFHQVQRYFSGPLHNTFLSSHHPGIVILAHANFGDDVFFLPVLTSMLGLQEISGNRTHLFDKIYRQAFIIDPDPIQDLADHLAHFIVDHHHRRRMCAFVIETAQGHDVVHSRHGA